MRTANPALNENVFSQAALDEPGVETMTVAGTANKSAILLMLVIAGAMVTWRIFFSAANMAIGAMTVMPLMWIGLIGGFIVALVTIFARRWAMFTAPLYAILEGLFLGALSSFLEAQFNGIVVQAVGLTFAIFICILLIYRTGIIKVTDNFRIGIVAATGGIALIYLVTIGMNLFGTTIPYIHSSGLIGIGFSVFVIIIATLNLVLDFDFIEHGAEMGAPKYMEWYAAFGLIVTLVWLYIEILRLLSKLRSR
jgi:uncharacterized YccA/Bax inhibitor family protein